MIEGLVTIKQDDKIIAQARNHLTALGAKIILATLNTGVTTVLTSYPQSAFQIRLGGTAQTPSFALSAMAESILACPTMTLTWYDGGTYFEAIYTGTTPAATLNTSFGSVSKLVNEMGLFAYGPTAVTTFKWTTAGTSAAYALLAYLASPGDYDSSAIIVNGTKSLTVEWRIRFTFT